MGWSKYTIITIFKGLYQKNACRFLVSQVERLEHICLYTKIAEPPSIDCSTHLIELENKATVNKNTGIKATMAILLHTQCVHYQPECASSYYNWTQDVVGTYTTNQTIWLWKGRRMCLRDAAIILIGWAVTDHSRIQRPASDHLHTSILVMLHLISMYVSPNAGGTVRDERWRMISGIHLYGEQQEQGLKLPRI